MTNTEIKVYLLFQWIQKYKKIISEWKQKDLKIVGLIEQTEDVC